jgi:excisionase family DNA binding protein
MEKTVKKTEPKFVRDGMPTAALDLQETAAYLAVSKATVRRLLESGAIPHARVLQSVRFRVQDLDAYLEAKTSREWKPEVGRGRPRTSKKAAGTR